MTTVNASIDSSKEYAGRTQTAKPTRGPIARSLEQLHLVDHAHMVRNSLEAVRCLTLNSDHSSALANRTHDTLDLVSRHHLCDLMEIITDRLGFALEVEAARECR